MGATSDDGKSGKVVRLDFKKAREEREAHAAPEDPWAPQKLEAFERLVDDGMVLVNLDSRVKGVSVPEHHRGDPQLGLNFSHRFYTGDFEYDEKGLRSTLSFRGEPYFCDIPWAAVFMLRSHSTDEVFLFPPSVPPELEDMLHHIEQQLAEQQQGRASSSAPVASLQEAGFAQDGDQGDDQSDSDDAPEPDPDSPPDHRPGLKLVKG